MSKPNRRSVVMFLAGLAAFIAVALGTLSGSSAFAATQKVLVPTHQLIVVPDFLRVAPAGHPHLTNGGLNATMRVQYACAPSNGFTVSFSEITIAIVQGGDILTGSQPAVCTGIPQVIVGFPVSGAVPLNRGLARVLGTLQMQEFSSANPKSDGTSDQNIVTLV